MTQIFRPQNESVYFYNIKDIWARTRLSRTTTISSLLSLTTRMVSCTFNPAEIPNPRKQKKRPKQKKTGVFIAALTIVNTIIGGGIVAMPWASYKVGLLVSKPESSFRHYLQHCVCADLSVLNHSAHQGQESIWIFVRVDKSSTGHTLRSDSKHLVALLFL